VSTLVRRSLIAVALVVAAVLLVYVYNHAVVGSDATSSGLPRGVERLIPESGSNVLTQSTVGIDLAEGFDADLEINGVRITNETDDPDGDGLRKNLTIGRVEYLPGPGKRIERLESTRNCVVAHVWKREDGPTTQQPVSWCFEAI
jgi:hypothetical protein